MIHTRAVYAQSNSIDVIPLASELYREIHNRIVCADRVWQSDSPWRGSDTLERWFRAAAAKNQVVMEKNRRNIGIRKRRDVCCVKE